MWLRPSAPFKGQRETTALYEVVKDNLETLYGAIGDGAIAARIPKHARKELEAYLDCGLLCRGFARLKCEDCGEKRLVAFSCKGRGFCPSCTFSVHNRVYVRAEESWGLEALVR